MLGSINGWPREEHQQWVRAEDLLGKVIQVGQPLDKTHPSSDVSAAALPAAHLVLEEVDKSYGQKVLDDAINIIAFG